MGSLVSWQECIEIGVRYLSQGNNLQAEHYFQESYEEAEKLGIPVVIAFTLRLFSTALLKNNKLDEAEKGFKKALEYCQELNNHKGIAEAKAGLAGVCYARKQFQDAVSWYNQSIDIYPQQSSPLRLAMLYADLGQASIRCGRWDEAENALEKARTICIQSKYHKGTGEINLFLGEISYKKENYADAVERFIEASKNFSVSEDITSLADTHQYLAFLLFETEQLDLALFYQQRVVALLHRKEDDTNLSESYYLTGTIMQYLLLLEDAKKYIEYSLSCYKGSTYGYAIRYQTLAIISIIGKNYEQAKEYYYKALNYFQHSGNSKKIGEICDELTCLIEYEEVLSEEKVEDWFNLRYRPLPPYTVLLRIAVYLKNKGDDFKALKLGWKAMEIARSYDCDTQEIESFIQDLSQRIRGKF